jgi:hypothetical protein
MVIHESGRNTRAVYGEGLRDVGKQGPLRFLCLVPEKGDAYTGED